MRKFGFLVVEGPHDVEFCYRLLNEFGLKRVTHEHLLDDFFLPLIPRQYPPKGDLLRRMPTPLFLQNDTHALAIHSAVGDSQLINVMLDNAEILDLKSIIGMGIILDSDNSMSALARFKYIKQEVEKKSSGFKLDDAPGKIKFGSDAPHLGVFVLPDNNNAGTLEDLLLDSAALVYPKLLDRAKQFVETINDCALNPNELSEFNKPAGKNKAIIGAMANILRPGKSVQVSIQDNQWLRGDALAIARVKAVKDFLQVLFCLAP